MTINLDKPEKKSWLTRFEDRVYERPVWLQVLIGLPFVVIPAWIVYPDLFTREGLFTVWFMTFGVLFAQLFFGRPFWTRKWGDAYDYAAVALLVACATMSLNNYYQAEMFLRGVERGEFIIKAEPND